VTRGAQKIVLDERSLPPLDVLAGDIAAAHDAGRDVAVHCVTRVELVLACAALRDAGARAGDRIEHAAVAPPEVADLLARLGVTVVTQPNFIRERGDQYLADVEPADVPWLYRCKGLLDAGVAVGGGTDAPYGDADPWLAMQAAVDRTTLNGVVLGSKERVTPERALALFHVAGQCSRRGAVQHRRRRRCRLVPTRPPVGARARRAVELHGPRDVPRWTARLAP
jgi:predicted amidohydrolase YtcJ